MKENLDEQFRQDVIEILSGSPRPRKYWNALKTKLKKEGSELSHKLGQLKMQSTDGKFYKTNVAHAEQLLRFNPIHPFPSRAIETMVGKSRL